MKLVQFGAGNIGRSFIGQVFSRAGWEVVFVDVDERLVKLLNEEQYYTVVIKREGKADEARRIGPVRAVDGRNAEAVAAELAGADLAATSVGKNALPKVVPVIASGIAIRPPARPLDIIIAENDRQAPALFRSVLSAKLGPEFPLDSQVGLVETSIGKMAPIMKAADLAVDPLLLFAEEYETLIVDKMGFRAPLPDIPAIFPVDPIAAYVDRKLFIHNLGHAAAAYLESKAALTIPEVLALPKAEESVRQAMDEAADALILEYPSGCYSRKDLAGHIEDLLFRFKNRSLGDTVHRVGRDLRRKLAREDRVTGAMLLCAKHNLPFKGIAKVYRAALDFSVPAEDGVLFPPDEEFRKEYEPYGNKLEQILKEVSGLDCSRPMDSLVIKEILAVGTKTSKN
ncbi:MAG: mannitol-1-phosphate 5-dehydrogenase [Treponema sp.]|jgi:mannitol-1-phosphate 5-dehydrogenase|nr:mannitol-1-phosphate 5-dehydrogenase [Treponema sp.]